MLEYLTVSALTHDSADVCSHTKLTAFQRWPKWDEECRQHQFCYFQRKNILSCVVFFNDIGVFFLEKEQCTISFCRFSPNKMLSGMDGTQVNATHLTSRSWFFSLSVGGQWAATRQKEVITSLLNIWLIRHFCPTDKMTTIIVFGVGVIQLSSVISCSLHAWWNMWLSSVLSSKSPDFEYLRRR